jgi:hypothetical protein
LSKLEQQYIVAVGKTNFEINDKNYREENQDFESSALTTYLFSRVVALRSAPSCTKAAMGRAMKVQRSDPPGNGEQELCNGWKTNLQTSIAQFCHAAVLRARSLITSHLDMVPRRSEAAQSMSDSLQKPTLRVKPL